MLDYEKLGVFYLGRERDAASGEPGAPLLYDARDLTTHAVIVGMTGSGKTGLGIAIIEEAILDGVPVLAIDPKGDLPNLLLTFPELAAADFEPWVHDDDARRQGLTRGQWAAAQAERWRRGLADWGQDGERIRRLRAAAEATVYTPGSAAGVGLSILDSLRAPAAAVREDGELMAERVATTATGLLALLGRDPDPLRRDHILIASLLDHAWRQGRDLELPDLIHEVRKPPLERVGVLEVEAFYPEGERFELAMALNNLLAAPGFDAWLAGEPLDVGRLLYDDGGRPRLAIVSLAHLAEAERMFVVTLLLDQALAWARSQPGTSSLRAVLYMDELFGYLPPVAEPPSKRPLLTLLKQARAHGLGLVLATQNPADLDYKALTNAGTWFIGRLQAERDRQRLLDGLESAAAGRLDRRALGELISGLDQRRFLLHDVRADAPLLFDTRWVMSYLAGPMTRDQIRRLMAGRAAPARPAPAPPASAPAPPAAAGAAAPPLLAPEVPQRFLPAAAAAGAALIYEPGLLGVAAVHFVDRRLGVEEVEEVRLWTPLPPAGGAPDWAAAEALTAGVETAETPPPAGRFAALPPAAGKPRSYAGWRKGFAEWLYRDRRLELRRSPGLGATSRPGESEREFRLRLELVARERRDAAVAALRERHAGRAAKLAERLHRARQRLASEQEQASRQRVDTAVSVGATVLSVLLGRGRAARSSLGRATTAARGFGRAREQSADVERAGADIERLEEELAGLDRELAAEIEAVAAARDASAGTLETLRVAPRRADVEVRLLALAWRGAGPAR